VIKNIAYFLMLLFIIFLIAPVGAVSSPDLCVPCNKVPITGLKLHVVTGIMPIKVGLIGSVKGPVSKVKYTVTNPTTGVEICKCSSFCPRCIKLGKCICSCKIKTPGIYEVRMTAYGPQECCVNKILKDVNINR